MMLDATTLTQASTVYRPTDPEQVIFRSLLAGYTDNELARVEDEIGMFSRTGLLPASIRSLLDAGMDVPAAA